MNEAQMWNECYEADFDLRFMKAHNKNGMTVEPHYSPEQIEVATERVTKARKAVRDYYVAVGSISAYKDARELIPDQDAGSIDHAIVFYEERIKA